MQKSTLLAWLVGYEGTTGEIRFELGDSETTIGRGSDCDIQLDDPLASRRHATIHFRPDGFEIEDLDSSNGTYVNNEQITSVPLNENDLIKVGETILKFRMQPDPDATIMQTRFPEETVVALRPTIPHEHGAVHCRGCGEPNPKGGKFCLKCGAALPQLPASFQKTLNKFNNLHTTFQAGELTSENYQAALKNLMAQDDEGEYWMLGMESGEWYWHDGDEWHLRLPPLILSEEKQTPQPDIPIPQEPDQSDEPPPARPKLGRWAVFVLWIFSALIVLALGIYAVTEFISYSRFRTLSQSDPSSSFTAEDSFDSSEAAAVQSEIPDASATPTLDAQDTRNEIQVRPYDPAIDGSLLSLTSETEFMQDESSNEHAVYVGFFPIDTPSLLVMGWCAIDQTTLESNLASIRMEGTFDSITIPSEMWMVENSQEEGMYCQYFRAVIEDLESGTHKFFWSTSYDEPIFDGWETYQPGTYLKEYIVEIEYQFVDEFISSAGHWGETEEEQVKVWIEGGDLNIELYEESIGTWSRFLDRDFIDFMTIIHAQELSVSSGYYGIAFRRDGDNFYYFEVQDEGFFRIGKRIGEFIDLIPWTASEAILRDGGVNRLTLSMEGNQIIAMINGELVADLQDGSLKEGDICLLAGTLEGVDAFHVAFQKVSIFAPE